MGKAKLYIRLKDNKDLLNFLAFCNNYNNIDESYKDIIYYYNQIPDEY